MSVQPALSPQAAADADAAALLAAFRAPPGAKELPGAPTVVPSLLRQPLSRPSSPDLVIRTTWWTWPGTPEQAVAWITAHAPSGSRADGSGASVGPGEHAVFEGFSRPPTATLSTRTVTAGAEAFHGGTLLRVDAEVVWLPQRPAAARVPAGVSRLVVLANPGRSATGGAPTLVQLASVTDPALLRRAAALVNALPMAGEGKISCPMDRGTRLRLEFYTTGSSPAAVVVSAVSGCLRVDLSVRGGPQHTALSGTTGFNEQLLALLGLRFPG
ncbi:hypothetical protein [Streptacidiphilus sp. MAP12-20]|uniref:hypothetical protein n=1 Tax=Streptacidiphilus sp. MAP12-20 TaxID=3156299 RepID=UPI003515C55B